MSTFTAFVFFFLRDVFRAVLFEAADENGDGRLDRQEFQEILADPIASRRAHD